MANSKNKRASKKKALIARRRKLRKQNRYAYTDAQQNKRVIPLEESSYYPAQSSETIHKKESMLQRIARMKQEKIDTSLNYQLSKEQKPL